MGFSRVHASSVLSLALGCSFDSGGGSGGASAEIGESADDVADASSGADDGDTSGGSNDPTTASSNDSTSNPDTDTADTVGGESTTMTLVGDAALLVFDEAPVYDFALVAVEAEERHVVTLTNMGGQPATAIAPAMLEKPFAWTGGRWPGLAGDCGETLEPSASCLVEVAFAPARLGPTTGAITIEYDDGETNQQAELGLAGGGSGSIELLANGDAEMPGDPPPEWSEQSGDGWTTTTQLANTGTRSITPGTELDGEVVLRQDRDVSSYAQLIDDGLLSINLTGWSRTLDPNNDPHFISIDFENADEVDIDTFVGVPVATTTWTETTDARPAPAGMRGVVVRLHCSKNGGTRCDAFFDDVSLALSYP